MQKIVFFVCFLWIHISFAQKSDFSSIDFSKADKIAKSIKGKKVLALTELTFKLTENLQTDVEKLRSIYIWICHNIANDFNLYERNNRKRKRFLKDSIRLNEWNSRFKKILFKKLLRKKRTICTGYAYLLKEMCAIAGIEAKMVHGFGRTSDVDLENLTHANHTWNLVKLNEKWYLCDATWATGISYPQDNKFVFNYNDGYFLTEPKIFIQNHYPANIKYSLLNDEIPTFKEFSEMPLFYAEAYNILKENLHPKKIYNEVFKNETFMFKYKIKENITLDKLKFIVDAGSFERTVKPKINLINDELILNYTFEEKGIFDVHLYLDNNIIASYTFKVLNRKD